MNADQKSAKKQAEKFAKDMHSKSIDFKNSPAIEELCPIDQKGKVFDAKEAKKNMKTKQIPPNDISKFIEDPKILSYKDFIIDNDSIKHSNSMAEQYQKGIIEIEAEKEYTSEKCLQADLPFSIELSYSLKVDVKRIPAKTEQYHICQGHEKITFNFFNTVKKEIRKQSKKLKSDPTVHSYHVEAMDGSDWIKCTWTHHENSSNCDNKKPLERVVEKENSEVHENWIVDNQESENIVKDLKCSLISTKYQDQNTKLVDGVEVKRKWRKISSYACQHKSTKCPFLGSYQCIQTEKHCIKKENKQCALWELTFKCLTGNPKKIILEAEETFGFDENLWDTSQKPNTSFSEATTKLKIFDEMKSEFEKSNYADITQVTIFGGQKSQCSKSIAGDLMYDCCFSLSGLTNKIKLSKCSADEIALAEKKEKGLCHYIGSYKEKMLKMWTSRKEHVYCCFPTKLGRVLQEQGRKQLGMDWGSPKKPNCRGLSQNEIQKLNLHDLDLSEAYEIKPSVDMETKIQMLEERLKRLSKEI